MRPPDIRRRRPPPPRMEIAQRADGRLRARLHPRANLHRRRRHPPRLQPDFRRLRERHRKRAEQRLPLHAEIERPRPHPPPRNAAQIAQRNPHALVRAAVEPDRHHPVAQHRVARLFRNLPPVRLELQPADHAGAIEDNAFPPIRQRGFAQLARLGQLPRRPDRADLLQRRDVPLRQRKRERLHGRSARQGGFRHLIIGLGPRRPRFALDPQALGVRQRHKRIPAIVVVFRQRRQERRLLPAEQRLDVPLQPRRILPVEVEAEAMLEAVLRAGEPHPRDIAGALQVRDHLPARRRAVAQKGAVVVVAARAVNRRVHDRVRLVQPRQPQRIGQPLRQRSHRRRLPRRAAAAARRNPAQTRRQQNPPNLLHFCLTCPYYAAYR